MKNSYFTDAELDVMYSNSKLYIVSDNFSELTPVEPDAVYKTWINKNSYSHNFRELLLVLSGNGFYTLGEKTYPVIPGAVFLIDNEVTHDNYYPPNAKNFKHLWFRFIRSGYVYADPYADKDGRLDNSCSFSYSSFNAEGARYGAYFMEAWNEFSSSKSSKDMNFNVAYLKNTFGALLIDICRKLDAGSSSNTRDQKTSLHHKKLMLEISLHIRETAGKNLDINKLAYLAGYSRFHFARIFREQTGFSVLEFMDRCRIEKYNDLKKLGYTQKQIASELGFSCPQSFSRWCRDKLSDL